LYGVHPFFMAVNEVNGRAFGVLIFNSNGQEYAFLPPYSLNYRTFGGILDIYIMEEESPEKLIQAYTSLIGLPYFPPYWSLGIIYFIQLIFFFNLVNFNFFRLSIEQIWL
jgi:alpha-glucosidase (family GH31 glycosyl hydrolase)